MNIDKSSLEKLKEIMKKLERLEIKEGCTKEEAIEFNEIFRLHSKFICLLERQSLTEEQYRRDRAHLIDGYLQELENFKPGLSLNIPNITNKEAKRKFIFCIDGDLKKKIVQYVEENSKDIQYFCNQALNAYADGMELNFKVKASNNSKVRLTCRLDGKLLEVYQTIPLKFKSIEMEKIIGSYLEKVVNS